jgi:hypothetical protein
MMIKANRNLFFCTTQYHLLLSLHIINEFYYNENYHNVVFITTGMRIDKNNYNKIYFDKIEFIEVDWFEIRTNLFLKKLVKNKCTSFFYFLSNFPVHRHMVRNFSKRGAKIILVQDGMKAYIEDPAITIKAFIYNIFTNIVEYYKIRDWHGVCFPFVSSKYVNDKTIDEFWLTHPKIFHKSINENQLIFEIPEVSSLFFDKVSFFFNYKCSLVINSNDFLYLTQALIGKAKENEIIFLKKLQSSYPNSKLYIKFHPDPSENKDLFFNALPNAIFLNDECFPAELLIHNLNKVNVISGNSSAFLIDNSKCRFFYIYPILNNNLVSNLIPSVSGNIEHIEIIYNLDDFNFKSF